MPRTPRLLRLAAAAVAVVVVITTGFSGATFVSQKPSAPSQVTSATDWNVPTVALTDPGSPLRGTVTLSASASDRDGIASVAFQRSPAGAATWTTIATDTTLPYSGALDTTGLADGSYDFRAVATDRTGETARSTVFGRLVDNTAPSATLADPGTPLRGTVTFSASADDGSGSGIASVRIQRAPAGTTTWTDVCTRSAAPYTCQVDTTQIPTDLYDLRVLATDRAGNTRTSATLPDIEIDNVLPTATMTDPGSPLSGTVTLAATASDADSGVASVVIQYAPSTGGSWTEACRTTASPYSCRFSTAKVADGLYDFRAVANDLAGNARTSAAVALRRIDNVASSVSMEDPGQFLRGTVKLTANAGSSLGVREVRIQWAPAGTAQWTTACTDTTDPYACDFDTNAGRTPDGKYDFRAVMVDTAGTTTTSATVAGRTVDNSPVRGFDVQATNASGGTAGRLEPGDRLSFWWTKPIAPGSLVPNWTGTGSAAVWVRVADNAADGTDDQLSIFADSGARTATGFGTVALKGNYVRTNRTVTFASSATIASAQVDGTTASMVTITLGTQSNGGLRTWTAGRAMLWTPSGNATDTTGLKVSTSPATETGALDRDF